MKKPVTHDVIAILDSLCSRREFMKLCGSGLGYTVLSTILPGCGGGSGSSDSGATAASIPAASAEYSVLKRTSFGAHRDALAVIHNLGIDPYLEQQLDYTGINDGSLDTDVKEVARCFTGWTIRFPGDAGGSYGSFVFQPAVHDDNAKVVLQNTIAAGGGQTDGEQVLDILAAHPSTARFIATKLCRRFISDSPDTATIDAVATAFSQSGGEITDTLHALFATAAFRSSSDLKLCRPAEYLAGVVRALAPDTPYPGDDGRLFLFAQYLLGQLPYYWPTPDGYPDEQVYWASTGGLLNRWRLSFLSFAPLIPAIGVFQIDYPGLLGGATTPATVVDALVANVLMRPLSASDRDTVIDWLVTETGVPPGTTLPPGIPEQIAALVAAVLISSAYFQLR